MQKEHEEDVTIYKKESVESAENTPKYNPIIVAIELAERSKMAVLGSVSRITVAPFLPFSWNDALKYGNFNTTVWFWVEKSEWYENVLADKAV